MIRLEKISGVLDHFSRPILNRIGVSRGVRAEIIIGIVLVLSTIALGLGVSVMSERSVSSESTNASLRETPPRTDLSNVPATTDSDVKDAPLGQLPVDVIAPSGFIAQAGTDISVAISVSDVTGLGIISWQGDILFDPAVLLPQPTSATTTGTISGGSTVTVNPFQSGKIKMAWFSGAGTPLEGSGTLVILRFVVVGPIGSTSPLAWERTPGGGRLVFEFNGGTVAANSVDGNVSVVAPSGPLPVGATPFGTPIVGTLQAGDTTRDNRLLRNSIFSGCTAKTCPGALGLYPVATISPSPTATATATPIVVTYPPGINTYRYDVIPFTNTTGQPQNFTFTTTVTGPGSVLPAIYAAPYNPTGIVCPAPSNYRGDPGGSAVPGGPVSFSVNIPAGATYDLVIEGDQPIISSTPSPPLQPIQAAPAVVPYTIVVTIPNCLGGTPTNTATPTNTTTPTNTATATATITNTSTPTATSTFTPTPSSTSTFTPSSTNTATPISTSTFTPTPSSTSTFTPTATATSTFTATPTATNTFTPTATATNTFTPTPSSTSTFTPTPSSTSTFTPSNTSTATATATGTATATATFTSTATATSTATPLAVSIQFSSPTYQEDESQTAIITITRTGTITGTDTVTFSTSNGTANGGVTCPVFPSLGSDYISLTQSVTFNPTETSKTVAIPLCGDGIIENDETVNLTLTGANIGVPGTAILTINDTATQFLNQNKIFINQGGAANAFPSSITVTTGPNVIGSMRLTLYDMSANIPDNADFLLVGPNGARFIIMANAGGLTAEGPDTLNITDLAGLVIPDNGPLTTTDYEPTSYGAVANFPAPAPAGPYNLPGSAIGGTGTQTLFGNFGTTSANGVWSLYVRDDTAGPTLVVGSIAGGWGLEFLGSTAASASISGRVMTADGLGIRNARIVITGNSLMEPRVATTGSFGWFTIDGLRTGETYVVTVNSQRYTFSTPSRVISLVDNVTDADFIANPQE